MKQPSLAHVLQPKWRTALQRLREERAKGGTGKLVILVLVGGAFWAGVFGVLYRILKALRGVEELGPLIPGKMLGLILLSFISILVLSNVITRCRAFSSPRISICSSLRPWTGCASISPSWARRCCIRRGWWR